jgi:hypothetical protein
MYNTVHTTFRDTEDSDCNIKMNEVPGLAPHCAVRAWGKGVCGFDAPATGLNRSPRGHTDLFRASISPSFYSAGPVLNNRGSDLQPDVYQELTAC